MSEIQGKVAAIVSERQIAINVGRNDGVRAGMKFAVLDSAEAEVVDPDTGEALGILDRIKARVQATDVRDRMTICTTYVKEFDPTREVLRYVDGGRTVALAPPGTNILPPQTAEDRYVKIGDRVRMLDTT